jgi:hypothetical protein
MQMEEGAHRTAGGHGISMLGTTESGTTTLNLGTSPNASYYIPTPPPPPPPLVIKRGKIRKMKKRFKTHKKDASKKDQLGDAKEADEKESKEKENKENKERENKEREEKEREREREREIKEREIKEKESKEKESKEKEEAESEKGKCKGVKLNTSVEFTPRTSVDSTRVSDVSLLLSQRSLTLMMRFACRLVAASRHSGALAQRHGHQNQGRGPRVRSVSLFSPQVPSPRSEALISPCARTALTFFIL